MTELHSPFPEPLEDDDDDVAWALQTAKVQWTRGGQADAIVWLKRAADSAELLGNVWRAADLRRMIDAIGASLVRPSRAPVPRAPVPRPPPAPRPSRAPVALPQFGSTVQLDDLLIVRHDDAVTSIPPPAAPGTARSSYVPVDDVEFEEDILLEDDDDDEPNVEVTQLRDSEVELSSEAELTEEFDVLDDEELDEVIEDDALDVPPTERHAFDSAEDLPTLPQIEVPNFHHSRLSPLPAPEADPHVADVLLGEVRGLEDVPPEGQAILAREARIERLGADEEIGSFGLALVVRGVVKVMPAIADLACARASKGDIVWSEGNLDDGIALRLVAAEDGTEVAVWEAELLKGIVRDYPWVVEDLKTLADRFQALAGVAMGPMGERLDDSLRAMVTERCEIKRLLPGEILTNKGKAVGGMYIMAAGRLEILAGDEIESELGPGDFLFGAQVLSNGAAPSDTRAGKSGALVLFASRSIAHDLLLSVPPLLEIFAS